MFSTIKITIFTILCAVFLLSSDISAQKTSDKPKETVTSTAAAKELELPEVDGWKKTVASQGDYIVNYDSPSGARVTVYIYDRGLETIENGIADEAVKDEFEGAKGAIRQLAEIGIYENVKEEKDETANVGGSSGKVKALVSRITMSVRGNNLASETYLFGHRNKFVKIRSTRPQNLDEKAKNSISDLLTELDKLFSK